MGEPVQGSGAGPNQDQLQLGPPGAGESRTEGRFVGMLTCPSPGKDRVSPSLTSCLAQSCSLAHVPARLSPLTSLLCSSWGRGRGGGGRDGWRLVCRWARETEQAAHLHPSGCLSLCHPYPPVGKAVMGRGVPGKPFSQGPPWLSVALVTGPVRLNSKWFEG